MGWHQNRGKLPGTVLPGVIGLMAFVLIGVASAPALVRAQQPAASSALVLDQVTVVDVEHGKLLPAQRIVIGGNRIQAMGTIGAVVVPKGARVVDAHGKYLIPGLWDMHTHAGRATDIFYPMMLANGITGIRDAGSMVPLDTLIQRRREILAGTRIGPPRQLFSGQSITNYPRYCDRSQLRDEPQTCVADSADAVHYVDSLKAAGADMIKLRDVYPPMYFTIAAEARRVGLPFGGHTWDNIAIMASDSGTSIIDHLHPWPGDYHVLAGLRWRCWAGDWPGRETVKVAPCRPVAAQFKRNHTWVVPTLLVDRIIGQKDGVIITRHARRIIERFVAYATEFWGEAPLRSDWLRDSAHSDSSQTSAAHSLGVLHVMQEAGLPVMAGTDAGDSYKQAMPPGFTLHAELALDVAEGLTPLNALQSATLNPAKFLRATDSLGTVAPGKLADLVLLDANPLADITNTTRIYAVMANGRYFDRAALDKMLVDARAKGKGEPRSP